MMRAFLGLLLAVALGLSASADASPWRLKIKAQGPSLPFASAVSFGEKTLIGHGGDTLGYGGANYLAVTGGTSGCGSLFMFDAGKRLVPRTGASTTYGGLPASYGVSSCSVTVAEYTSRSGSTVADFGYSGATGVSGSVAISLIPHTFTIAANAGDTTTSNELRGVMNRADAGGTLAFVAYGDTIQMRSGTYLDMSLTKPRAWVQRSGGPAAPTRPAEGGYYGACAGCAGEGWVRVTSETPMQARIKSIQFSSSNTDWHLRFTRVRFEDDGPFSGSDATNKSGSHVRAIVHYNSAGDINWLQFDNNVWQGKLFGSETVANTRNAQSALWLANNNTGLLVYDNSFDNFWSGVQANFYQGDYIGNTFTRCTEDCIDGTQADSRIWFNRWILRDHAIAWTDGVATDQDPHVDYVQDGGAANASTVGTSFIGNMMVAGTLTGGQGLFLHPETVFRTGGVMKGNLYLDKYQNAFRYTACDTCAVKYNTALIQLPYQAADSLPIIHMGDNDEGPYQSIDPVVSHNIVAGTISSIYNPTDNIMNIDTLAEMLDLYDGASGSFDLHEVSDIPTIISAMTPKAAATGKGAIGTGVDFIAQTASFPDGSTYVRPRELP